MEVVQGTEADRKGGHVARRRSNGQLCCARRPRRRPRTRSPSGTTAAGATTTPIRWWIDLQVLSETLDRSDGVLELPLIVNHKTVDPRDASSTPVIQLESAMGAAIERLPRRLAAAGAAHAVRAGQDHR